MKKMAMTPRQRKNRALGQLYMAAYHARANEEAKESTSSLIENYEAFLRAPAVLDYFFLVGNLTTLLAHFYETSVKSSPEMNAVLNYTCSMRDMDRKSMATEMIKLESLMNKAMIRAEMNESFMIVATSQWRKNIATYIENTKKRTLEIDRITLLEEVFKYNLTGHAEGHELYWSGVILDALGEKDFYHQQIVRRLEQNATSLARHYATIRNVVCFKALVILTIWSYAHRGHTFDDDAMHLLVYGDFMRDYRVFKALAIKNTSIHLAYIDFELSRHSDAITLHIKSDKDRRVFDDVFSSGVLELSAMIHSTGISNKRTQLLNDVVEQEKPSKNKAHLFISESEDDDDEY